MTASLASTHGEMYLRWVSLRPCHDSISACCPLSEVGSGRIRTCAAAAQLWPGAACGAHSASRVYKFR